MGATAAWQAQSQMLDLNPDTLATLRSYSAPGMDFVAEVVGAYLGSIDGYFEQLSAAVSSGDADGVHRAAHPLKSSSMQVGAEAFSEACKELERAGRDGQIEQLGPLYTVAMARWQVVKPLLEAALSEG